jgi:hypothetical protein
VPAGERLLKLERAVLDEFGIEATVGAEVDVFEKDSVERGGDGGAGVRGVDGDNGGGDDCGFLRVLAEEGDRNKDKGEGGGAKCFAHEIRVPC